MTPAQCRAARALLGCTQAHLSMASGVSPRVVRGFEGGTQNVASKSIAKMREAFEASGIAFISGGGLEGLVRRT